VNAPHGAHDNLRMRADPLADDTIARLLGPCDGKPDWPTIAIVNRQLERWQRNGDLAHWKADASVPAQVAAPLEAFVAAGLGLPDWADAARIERAEALFFDYGALSCTLLFCSSLPECYVIPDLAAVLHVAGQLEQHTEYRIRATAAMIFPVMMRGGLTTADGGGVAQVLKVRLIHATIRHLILRGAPAQAMRVGVVPPLQAVAPSDSLHQALFAHGWNIADDGLPCNQEELAYTLLTFSYVFLRSLRKLGLGLSSSDEEAYLHAWNVMGHVLGIERALMADTMAQAEVLFAQIQARGRGQPYLPDPRPALGQALMQTMEAVIPLRAIRPFPVLMTRYLCGSKTAKDLGIDQRVSWLPRLLFALFMLVTRAIDAVGRLFFPEFSIARLITRVVGYQFTVKVLMDQTRPLKLPPALLNQVAAMTRTWHLDPKAPRWMNALEQKLTGRGKGAQS
jgi:hypothetical protein